MTTAVTQTYSEYSMITGKAQYDACTVLQLGLESVFALQWVLKQATKECICILYHSQLSVL